MAHSTVPLFCFKIVVSLLRKDFTNKLYLAKQMGEDQLDELELDGCDGLILSFDFNLDQLQDLELDGPITLRILDGIAWDVTQAKGWR